MRKEYRDIAKVDDIFNAIDDFFSNAQITSLYTLIDSQSDRRVYHNISENLDLIFYEVTGTIYDTNLHYVILLVTTQYDSSKEVWFLPDVVCSGMNTHVAGAALGVRRVVYYFPAPTLIKFMNNVHNAKLVINFNSENNTFMLSLIWYCKSHNARYEFARTSNMCFGMMEKSLDFDGGFFFGGDFMYTYEWIYGEDKDGNTITKYVYVIHNSEFHSLVPHADGTSWYNAPYESQRDSTINSETVNRFDAILRASIDYAPMRDKNNELKPPSTSPTDATKPYFVKEAPLVVRNQTWATTMDLGYYVPMVCSITASTKAVPRYAPLLSETQYDRGRMTNSVNKMTLVMPLWFMVKRDPEVLDDYSYAGKNNVINYVNMRYMDTDRVIESSFPTQEEVNKYNCFQMGSRRARFGMKGYSGLAFKIEGDSEEVKPEPELVYKFSYWGLPKCWNKRSSLTPAKLLPFTYAMRSTSYPGMKISTPPDAIVLRVIPIYNGVYKENKVWEDNGFGTGVLFKVNPVKWYDAVYNHKNYDVFQDITEIAHVPKKPGGVYFDDPTILYDDIVWESFDAYPQLKSLGLGLTISDVYSADDPSWSLDTYVGIQANTAFNKLIGIPDWFGADGDSVDYMKYTTFRVYRYE